MDNIWAVIFGWIPHLSAASYVGLALYGLRMSLRRVLVVGVSISFAGYGFKYLINMLHLPYGLHVPISVLLLVVALRIFVKVKWRTAIIAAISSYIIITIVEVFSLMVMYQVLTTQLTIDEILAKWWLQVTIIHLESIPIYILAGMLHTKRVTLYDLSNRNQAARL